MRRVPAFLLAVLCCWLGPVSATLAHAAPARPATAYTYGGHHNDSALMCTMTERGLPASNESNTTYDAVDRWSHDAAARSDRPAPLSIITYDPTAMLVQSVGVVMTALEATPDTSGRFSSRTLPQRLFRRLSVSEVASPQAPAEQLRRRLVCSMIWEVPQRQVASFCRRSTMHSSSLVRVEAALV